MIKQRTFKDLEINNIIIHHGKDIEHTDVVRKDEVLKMVKDEIDRLEAEVSSCHVTGAKQRYHSIHTLERLFDL